MYSNLATNHLDHRFLRSFITSHSTLSSIQNSLSLRHISRNATLVGHSRLIQSALNEVQSDSEDQQLLRPLHLTQGEFLN